MFQTIPGMPQATFDYIPITGTPVCVPPRCIPAYYREEVEQQIEDIMDKGIIEESSSHGWTRQCL